MSCTTLLVGKKASYDGSTMIARNDDSAAGSFTPKKLAIVLPQDQPRRYTSVISHVEIDLPDDPLRYSAVPNALEGEGIWAGAGINAANVAMTATETIASNERVLGADPLVVYCPPTEEIPMQPGGIGEEDLVTIVLPYIRSAREGVLRTARQFRSGRCAWCRCRSPLQRGPERIYFRQSSGPVHGWKTQSTRSFRHTE